MRIDQKRILNVSAHDDIFIRINVIYVVCDVNSFSLSTLGRFDDPNIFMMVLLLRLHVLIIKIFKLIRQNVGIWDNVKRSFSMQLLHFKYVFSELVFSCNLIRARKMIDLLKFIQSFVNLWFAWSIDPHHIPIMAFSIVESSCF